MNNPPDPMQGFLDQLLRDWESGGAKQPAKPTPPQPRPSTAASSVVRSLPELSEAVSLSAVEPPAVAPAPAPPAIAEPAKPAVSVQPAQPLAQPPAEAPSKPAFIWKPTIPAAQAAVPPPLAAEGETPPKPQFQWKPASNPPPTAGAPPPDLAAPAATAATAPSPRPAFQWRPTSPPPAAAATPVVPISVSEPATVIRELPVEAPAPVAESARPAFQWKPLAESKQVEDVVNQEAAPVTEGVRPAFHWKPLAETKPVEAVVNEEAAHVTESVRPAFQWKPLAEPKPVEAAAVSEEVVVEEAAQVTESVRPAFQWKPLVEPKPVEAAVVREEAAPVDESPLSVFQWKPPVEAAPMEAIVSSGIVTEAVAPVNESPLSVFQWKPAGETEAVEAAVSDEIETEELAPVNESPVSVFQWKPLAETKPVEAAIVSEEPTVEPDEPVASESVDTAPVEAAVSEGLVAEETAPVYENAQAAAAPPTLIDFAAALQALKVSKELAARHLGVPLPVAPAAETVEVQPEPIGSTLEAEPEAALDLALALDLDIEVSGLLEVLLNEQTGHGGADQVDEPNSWPDISFAAPAQEAAPESAPEPEETVEVLPAAVELAPAETALFEPETEWEELGIPDEPVRNDGYSLGSVIADLETSLPAGQWDPHAAEAGRVELRRHLVFVINDERYAVNLNNLVEIDNMPNWTGIPGLPQSVRGLINLRGEIVSLLELRAILGLPYPAAPKKGKIFVATTADRQTVSAFAVDEIEGIVGFDEAGMTPVPPLAATPLAKSITATVEDGDHLVRILDVGAVLTEIEQTFSPEQVWM